MTRSLHDRGRAWVFGNDLEADVHVLEPRLALSRTLDGTALAQSLFDPVRPGLAQRIQPGDIIVAGHRFLAGKLHAPVLLALRASGIGVASLAMPFAVFRRLVNSGIPAIRLHERVSLVLDGADVEVDYTAGTLSFESLLVRGEGMADSVCALVAVGGLEGLVVQSRDAKPSVVAHLGPIFVEHTFPHQDTRAVSITAKASIEERR